MHSLESRATGAQCCYVVHGAGIGREARDRMSINSCFVITMEHDASGCTKKSRKPYTLTKQRESWTNDEHERFIKALQLYNRDWKKIESYVGTKTVVQVRASDVHNWATDAHSPCFKL